VDRHHLGTVCPCETGFAKRFGGSGMGGIGTVLSPPSHMGCPLKWPLRRMLPQCFPPVSTARCWFYLWRDNRLWLSVNHALQTDGGGADSTISHFKLTNLYDLAESHTACDLDFLCRQDSMEEILPSD